jgi:lysozyme family protein
LEGLAMNSFEDAFAALMGNEGKYVDNSNDPGGATMYGVTERVARKHGYTDDMRNLPLDLARSIAKSEYWDPFGCDGFDPRIGFQVFDAAYNGGHPVLWLQQAVGATADGVTGPKTIAAVAAADPLRVVILFNAARIRYYTSLNTWPSFGKGWSNRIANNLTRSAS